MSIYLTYLISCINWYINNVYLEKNISIPTVCEEQVLKSSLDLFENKDKASIWTLKNSDLDEIIISENINYPEESIEIQLNSASEKQSNIDDKHIKTPDRVVSLYYTGYSIWQKHKLKTLYDLVENTEVNSVTIDIKTVSGYTNIDFSDFEFWSIKPKYNWVIKDIKSIIEELHNRDIYVIWRVSVFKDQFLTKTRPDLSVKWVWDKSKNWEDYNKNRYLDPGSKEVWEYIYNISWASYELWFDEINFDYIRFPSDWVVSQTYYPFSSEKVTRDKWWKIKVIDEFWNYISSSLKEKYKNIVLSADVFWSVTNVDIYQIWQNLESFFLNFDYVSPMIYPSHYATWYLWATIPDNIPYHILKNSIFNSNKRIDKLNKDIKDSNLSWTNYLIKNAFTPKKDLKEFKEIPKTNLRPWIQWFSCTRCDWATPYNRKKFREQIRGMEEWGIISRFVWNSASNYYKNWYWGE